MSKRVCLSLLSAPHRSHQSTCLLRQRTCTAAFITLRDSHVRQTRSRPFSSSQCRAVGVQRMAGRGNQKAQPSMSIQQKQAMKKMTASGEVLDYIGLLQDTFVPPTGAKMPSLFSDFSGRRKIAWYQFKNYLVLTQSRFMAFWFVKPRLKLQVWKTPQIAKGLYESMYQAFAEGNIGPIEDKLSPGLRGSLKSRIAQRQPNTFLKWKLHKYIGPPERVSFKFAMPDLKSPNTQRTGIIQAVIRIKSQQSLLHMRRQRMKDPATRSTVVAEVPIDRDGKEIVDFDEEVEERKNMKTMTEYFVIERTMIKGVLGQWRAWGTTEETDLGTLRKTEREKTKALLGEQRM
ncbi:Putative inner membrane mitoribosome receptor Mba1 [Septoria linicola]|uniref:Inner membrane mitoribosome receptor Mba1 n=1 Tax=Septoria linicola TaxID=215465 RepID=A0A9Q9EH82_9PEZI|nr:putative inner membrane mitoribosome receptor Mba1 [Septoria linicola]USW50745.1 Putative inner membrane mitoribosome receptor Mba1 [Septoria linicola]